MNEHIFISSVQKESAEAWPLFCQKSGRLIRIPGQPQASAATEVTAGVTAEVAMARVLAGNMTVSDKSRGRLQEYGLTIEGKSQVGRDG